MKQKLDKAGGQAVIKGVMMKSGNKIATATIRLDKTIELHQRAFKSLQERFKIFSLPIIRGFVNLLQMMTIGYSTLQYSADRAMLDEGTVVYKSKLRTKIESGLTFLISIALGLGLFVALPYFVSEQLPNSENNFSFNIIAGIFRVILFLAYLIAISWMKDIKEIFQFHGAEHKTINSYEKTSELNPENISKETRINPRCGTSFIFLVLIISIFLFSVLDSLISMKFGRPLLPIRTAYHILCIPIIAGISYEVLKFSDRYIENKLVAFLISPGLLLQRITTKEPTIEQIEVAVVALKAALNLPIDDTIKRVETNV